MDDLEKYELKPDHQHRPLYVVSNKHIFLEAFSNLYEQAYDFLISIAEPISRPSRIHEYVLTQDSLYAAFSLGLPPETVLSVLEKLSKCHLPGEVRHFIATLSVGFGKVKLLLKDGNYFIESTSEEVLREINDIPIVKEARKAVALQLDVDEADDGFLEDVAPTEDQSNTWFVSKLMQEDDADADFEAMQDQSLQPQATVQSFQIHQKFVEMVKQACYDRNYPLLSEFDFHKTPEMAHLEIDLKPSTNVRPYQERCLNKMFGNNRARSGLIVLPCGAGKTLVGITAVCTIKKNALIMCNNTDALKQWREALLQFTNVQDGDIKLFSSGDKDSIPDPKEQTRGFVCLTTYKMYTQSNRSDSAAEIFERLRETVWGIQVLDEVHSAPAKTFSLVTKNSHCHCRLGLSATLVREDEKIKDLIFMVGPKLYEANWLDLTKMGYLARVKCMEIHCDMTAGFYREYLNMYHSKNKRRAEVLAVMNPNKFRTCHRLLQYHIARNDKIIIFSDSIPALTHYSRTLNLFMIHGGVSSQERDDVYQRFRMGRINAICLSRVGDVAIDLPEANVLIEISSQGGSRRQEAQRLGRILRPKSRQRASEREYNAFFYCLISKDTRELYFSEQRQRYLVDQGYAYHLYDDPTEIDPEMPDSDQLTTREKQDELLANILNEDHVTQEKKLLDKAEHEDNLSIRRREGDSGHLSGARGRGYGTGRRRDMASRKRKREQTEKRKEIRKQAILLDQSGRKGKRKLKMFGK
eukprot:TRINITY_DN123348_c0_g1_i1.p1 TRINITY_DN123348_c0_g1~~TRINITY_DN123348_c0_g1_i1.p1  ORF type:complete len:751 (+),score=192.64 TRINITY_DN123348_c0_g1_i1:99-2351(+)